MAQSVVRLPHTSTTPPRTRSRGRPKGRLNNATLEVRAFFRDFFESPRYRENLKRRILAGEANHMEILGHYYAFGKPKSTIAVESPPESKVARAIRKLTPQQAYELYELAIRVRDIEQGKVIDAEVAPAPAKAIPARASKSG